MGWPRAILLLALAGLCLGADLHVWVDEHGATHVTDDAAQAPGDGSAASSDRPEALRELWGGDELGEPLATPRGASGTDADRIERMLRDALEDLRRGESARASATLTDVLRREPANPEAHFYLALLAGRRGHLDEAEAHLHAFLDAPGSGAYPAWRASAERRLAQLEDERRLMASPAAEGLRLVDLSHPAFRIQADAALLASGADDFAARVARYLEDAHALVASGLGVTPREPTGVVLYGRAAYRQAFAHRFSFQTVGFYDGRIHVVSAAHPAGELRTLLVHEYTHALFHEQTGGDRPFWWNEGLAELYERRSQARPTLSHSEWASLNDALETGEWIPLRQLAAGFSGLTDDEARLAYRIGAAAAEWIDRATDPPTRARLLQRLGEGVDFDTALREAVGRDTDGVERALGAEIRGAFPADAAVR